MHVFRERETLAIKLELACRNAETKANDKTRTASANEKAVITLPHVHLLARWVQVDLLHYCVSCVCHSTYPGVQAIEQL